jgi:hypothetical protein
MIGWLSSKSNLTSMTLHSDISAFLAHSPDLFRNLARRNPQNTSTRNACNKIKCIWYTLDHYHLLQVFSDVHLRFVGFRVYTVSILRYALCLRAGSRISLWLFRIAHILISQEKTWAHTQRSVEFDVSSDSDLCAACIEAQPVYCINSNTVTSESS